MKNKLIILVVVAIAFFAYYFISQPAQPPEPSSQFEANFEDISNLWETRGVDVVTFDDESLDNLFALSESKLDTLKSDLELYKSNLENSPSTEKLTEIYILMIELAKINNQIEEKELLLENTSILAPCDNVSDISALLELEKQRFPMFENFNSQVDSFVSQYPDSAELAGIKETDYDISSIEQDLSDRENSLAELEAGCSA